MKQGTCAFGSAAWQAASSGQLPKAAPVLFFDAMLFDKGYGFHFQFRDIFNLRRFSSENLNRAAAR
jgi:hypothetical protein